MRTPRPTLAALANAHDREATTLEEAAPHIEARRTTTLLISQRVVDKLAADVAASDAERSRFLREHFKASGPSEDVPVTLAEVEAALKVRELALVELFSDRVLDFAEEAGKAAVAAGVRAKVLRETATALRAVQDMQAPEDAAGDEARVDVSPPPESAPTSAEA